MNSFGYIVKRILRMNYAALSDTLTTLKNETGRSRLWLLWDMWQCAVRYGAGYADYALFEMYRLTHAQRNTYLTRGRNNELMKRYNDPQDAVIFDDKRRFNTRFSEYIHREFVCSDDSRDIVLAFLRRHKTVILKPANGMCGKGVERMCVTDENTAYSAIQDAQNPLVIEQELVQHEVLSAVYPFAVNTVRIVTVLQEATVHIVCAYWRIGNGGNRVDNFNHGGMVAPVDEVSGVVRDCAVDKQKRTYDRHPFTDMPIKGVVLPFWKEALALVTAAAKEVPSMRYIGWDVALTPNGPCVVEGNNFPGHDIYQLPAHTLDGIGMWDKFKI